MWLNNQKKNFAYRYGMHASFPVWLDNIHLKQNIVRNLSLNVVKYSHERKSPIFVIRAL